MGERQQTDYFETLTLALQSSSQAKIHHAAAVNLDEAYALYLKAIDLFQEAFTEAPNDIKTSIEVELRSCSERAELLRRAKVTNSEPNLLSTKPKPKIKRAHTGLQEKEKTVSQLVSMWQNDEGEPASKLPIKMMPPAGSYTPKKTHIIRCPDYGSNTNGEVNELLDTHHQDRVEQKVDISVKVDLPQLRERSDNVRTNSESFDTEDDSQTHSTPGSPSSGHSSPLGIPPPPVAHESQPVFRPQTYPLSPSQLSLGGHVPVFEDANGTDLSLQDDIPELEHDDIPELEQDSIPNLEQNDVPELECSRINEIPELETLTSVSKLQEKDIYEQLPHNASNQKSQGSLGSSHPGRGFSSRKAMRKLYKRQDTVCRDQIIAEVIKTEETYVENLRILILHYMRSIRESKAMSDINITKIFGSVELIYEFNKVFLHDLASKEIGQVFTSLGDFLKMYNTYARGFDTALQTLEKLKQTSKLQKLLKEKRTDHPDLESLLILPIQRCPRYVLLIQQLLKFTPQSHPAYPALKSALKKILDVTNQINESKRKLEKSLELLEIQNNISDFDDLIAPGRYLVLRGTLHRKTRSQIWNVFKENVFYLFNDLLLWTTHPTSHEKCRFKGAIDLKFAVMEQTATGFILTGSSSYNKTKYNLEVNIWNEETLKHWCEVVEKHIAMLSIDHYKDLSRQRAMSAKTNIKIAEKESKSREASMSSNKSVRSKSTGSNRWKDRPSTPMHELLKGKLKELQKQQMETQQPQWQHNINDIWEDIPDHTNRTLEKAFKSTKKSVRDEMGKKQFKFYLKKCIIKGEDGQQGKLRRITGETSGGPSADD